MSKENNLTDFLKDMSNVFRLAYGEAPNSETHKFNPQDFVDNIAIPNISFVDLGDLIWTMEVGSGDVIITRFYATMPNDCINTQSVDVVNLYTEKYENSASVISSRNEDKKIALYSTNADEVKIYICDNNSEYTTADAFKIAVKGAKLFYGVNLGGKLTYPQFTERFGLDLTLTEYVKAMYLEAPVFGVGVNVITNSDFQGGQTHVRLCYLSLIANLESKGLRKTPYIYCEGLETISDGRTIYDTQPFSIYTDNPQASGTRIYITLPPDWTDEQCKAYLKGKKILYKLKGYYTTTINGPYDASSMITYDKTKPLTVTLLSRKILVKGSANDTKTILVYIGAGNVKSCLVNIPVTLSSGGTEQYIRFYANGDGWTQSQGYKVKVRLKVEQ